MIQTDYSTLTIENHRMYARLRDHQFSLYEDYARKRGLQGKITVNPPMDLPSSERYFPANNYTPYIFHQTGGQRSN